jgi:hypothetical protein
MSLGELCGRLVQSRFHHRSTTTTGHNFGPELRARTSAVSKPDAIPDVMRVATAEEGAASNVEA